jgi:formylglycine-generating enzyme required for sulfatase activity
VVVVSLVGILVAGAQADTFGTGANQFTLDFVPISGTTNPTNGIPAGDGFTFTGVNHDYRMGTYEITNDQWNKFTASLGVPVTGIPSLAYDSSFYDYGTGTTNVPANNVSWYEAAQFVNWLNTSTGHQAAYKFTGTQGQSNYLFVDWSPTDAGYDASNPYRNQNAFYFLPNENEWVKAAYWNGTMLQTYETVGDVFPPQGDGTSGTGWNYYNNGYATNPYGPWNVGSGSQELNGTYDMMGNNWELLESPYGSGDYGASAPRVFRGGGWTTYSGLLSSSSRVIIAPANDEDNLGFRVASVPEPDGIGLLFSSTLALLAYSLRAKRRA